MTNEKRCSIYLIRSLIIIIIDKWWRHRSMGTVRQSVTTIIYHVYPRVPVRSAVFTRHSAALDSPFTVGVGRVHVRCVCTHLYTLATTPVSRACIGCFEQYAHYNYIMICTKIRVISVRFSHFHFVSREKYWTCINCIKTYIFSRRMCKHIYYWTMSLD